LIALVLVAGCGGDDDESSAGAQPVPAAGELTPGTDTPGVPTGASYDMVAADYTELSAKATVRVADDFIDDHPKDCEGAEAGRVAAYAFVAIGTDFPLTAPVADVLTEGCAADLQS
jgi:hypothetical protein